MSVAFADLTNDIRQRSSIAAEDVLALRRLVWGDQSVSREEADALMALNTACRLQATEWVDYFVEVMVDYLVHQETPEGYVDDAKSAWLMGWIDKDGAVNSLTELELLVKVMETAESVPAALRDYSLKQIEAAVLTGQGATRNGFNDGDGRLDATCINATEVELLRRMIFAQSGDDAYIVSTAEADMLFRLKDATLGANNAPTWPDLFVKAVGNHLMAHRNYETLSREDKLRMDAYEADTTVSIGRFFRRMVGREGAALSPAALSIADKMNDDAAAAVDHAITPQETQWTLDHIRADGHYDPVEKALVAFIRKEMMA